MEKYICITLFICCISLNAFSQTQPKQETIVSSNNEIMLNELASFNIQYLLDEFMEGKIYYPGKEPVKTVINYNLLMDAIQYYDENNKLLNLVSPQPPDSVELGGHVLIPYNKNGFMEVFHTEGGSFYLRRSIQYTVETLVRGAYGNIERTSATDRVNNISGQDQNKADFRILNASQNDMEIRMRYRQSFLFPADDGGMIELSNRRAVTRAFPVQSNKVNQFLRQNNIDFDSVESLKLLVKFLNTL